MDSMTIDQERGERLSLDKKNVRCESTRRSIEVLSQAIRQTFQIDDSLTKELVVSLKEKIGRLNSTLTELN